MFPDPRTQIMENFIDQNLHSELHSEINWKPWNVVDNMSTLNQAETLIYSEGSFLGCRLGKRRDASKADTLAVVQRVADICMVRVK